MKSAFSVFAASLLHAIARQKLLLPLALVAVGAGAVATAVGADFLGIGQGSGLGIKQFFLLCTGSGALLAGALLASPLGQRYILAPGPLEADRPVNALVLGAFVGLASGMLEPLLLMMKVVFRGEAVPITPSHLWMSVVASTAFFCTLALVLLLLARRWSKLGSPAVATFVFAFCAVLGAVLVVSQAIEPYAVALLSAGIAFVCSRWVGAHTRGFSRLVQAAMGWSAALSKTAKSRGNPESWAQFSPSRRDFVVSTGAAVAAVALSVEGWRHVSEGRTIAGLPRAASKAPNVLLIVLDTVRAQSLSLYGYSRSTSANLERLAEQGVRFDRALAPSPWTLPSHASIFWGRHPHELMRYQLVTPYPSLAAVLSRHGYATAGFVANLWFCPAVNGVGRGFVHYDDFPVSPGSALKSWTLTRLIAEGDPVRELLDYRGRLDQKYADRISRDFLTWLSRNRERPFFAFLNYMDAHEPYHAPGDFAVRFAPKKPLRTFTIPSVDQLSSAEVRELNDAYDSAIAYLDHCLGKLFLQLQRLGVMHETLVIVTSDHGEQFGEHGLMEHSASLYMPLLHVPLVIRFPERVPRGIQVAQPVGLRDLGATITDLIGLENEAFPGRSLARHWSPVQAGGGPAEPVLSEVGPEVRAWRLHPSWYPAMKGEMKSLVIGSTHYIKNYGDNAEELYDLQNDPLEERNLAGAESARPLVEQARASLSEVLLRQAAVS